MICTNYNTKRVKMPDQFTEEVGQTESGGYYEYWAYKYLGYRFRLRRSTQLAVWRVEVENTDHEIQIPLGTPAVEIVEALKYQACEWQLEMAEGDEWQRPDERYGLSAGEA